MLRIIQTFLLVLTVFFAEHALSDIKSIAKEYDNGNLSKAIALAHQHKYKDLVLFLRASSYLDKNSNASFEDLASFIQNHPNLLQKKALTEKLESKITNSTSAHKVIKWFSHNSPKTANGYFQYYRAAKDHLKNKEALKFIVKNAWIYGNIPSKQASQFLAQNKTMLDEEDHVSKISELLWRKNIEEAQKYIYLVDNNYKQAFKAWSELIKHGKHSEHEFHKVKGSYRYLSGLLHAYLSVHKKTEPNTELINLHLKAPIDDRHAKEWWALKNYFARELIEQKLYSPAYRIVAKHSNKDLCDFVDAEWLAGWIALRFDHKPDYAEKHFTAVLNASKSSISRARGAYWLARAYDAKKDKDQATKYYKVAADYGFTYYGMLAANALGSKKLHLPAAPTIDAQDKKSLQHNHASQVAEMFAYSSRKELLKLYGKDAFMACKTKGEMALLYSRLAKNLDLHWRVEVAKLSSQAGLLLLDAAFPTPHKYPLNQKESAYIYAIMRQESVFDANAVSGAGAHGLMQVMPNTAKLLSSELGAKHNPRKLLHPEYNMRLGSHYLEKELSATHSYVLTSCEYNAGPAYKKWLDRFGDPRQMKLRDAIDWIELIPFGETRTYVQRVIENLEVYRYVLNKDSRLHIAEDLVSL